MRGDLQEVATRERTDNSLRVMRSHLISIRQRVERRNLKPSEINEILSNLRDVSKFEATLLSEHSTVSGPELPQMPGGCQVVFFNPQMFSFSGHRPRSNHLRRIDA